MLKQQLYFGDDACDAIELALQILLRGPCVRRLRLGDEARTNAQP